MPNDFKRILLLIAVLSNIITPTHFQIAMYLPPPPVFALPPPMAVAIQLPLPTTTTSTTTTPEPPVNIAVAVPIPVPMPMPVQFAVPAALPPVFCQTMPRPKSCPPCPPCVCMPSCTPAFFSFCSPCHLKCRCQNAQRVPVPMPPQPPIPVPGPAYPMPVPVAPFPPPPQSVVVIPFPPPRPGPFPPKRKKRCHVKFQVSSDSDDESCDGNDRGYHRTGKRNKRRNTRLYRRNAEHASDNSDSYLIKPIVSYISENGDVKFESTISRKDAIDMLRKTNKNSIIRSKGS